VSTKWIVGETCALLVARKRPHLVARFLDCLDRSTALLLVNPDDTLLNRAKAGAKFQKPNKFFVSFSRMARIHRQNQILI
jgi:hypothetical protein